jgi:hypothetical protein
VGVALIVGASAHSLSGVVSAVLVGAAIFAGFTTLSLTSGGRRFAHDRATSDATRRSAYRRYAEDIEHEVLEKLHRRRSRSRRAKSGAAPEG